ncbi:MAG TPA: UDP-N-acetylmuramoylalanyl-D-glutamyl-2, 6-diaminopimelate--D-alanyl-D-alanine ligase [Chloroflexi bacterium]|nr:UDP-N-acetylmuramoylalanyl-D-glutamyl-2, 6-diaminopimelate--D-alanyl-D-alanine ligase [Chloroflexota bacterium]HBY09106.1 UDP-N-acetylmuramoylalanyl-D-glutamyl-2, 6-diaminopimelate--D-alanyl-D-alanine ligase [Chloroflexota bacterium]
MLALADIIEAITGHRPAWAHQIITDASVDSRQIIPGALFVALPGERVDGHDFVEQAFSRGACFALVQREIPGEYGTLDLRGSAFPEMELHSENPVLLRVDDTLQALQQIARFWRSRLNLRVIGITGSVGKSTSKELIATVLEQSYSTLKNPGNLNNEIGLPLTILRLSEGHQCAVLEMGFYVPGEIRFLCDIAKPDVGVITNIGTVHAERAGSQEAIARGKAELVESLPAAPDGVAILNYDDRWVRSMAAKTQAKIMFYGLNPEADIWADQIEGLGLEGIRFRLHYQREILHLRVPLIGRHSVHTVLRATAVGLAEGMNWQEIITGLRSGHTQLRLVAVRSEAGALLLDDTYNASPQSMLAALNLLDEMDGRKIAVLGDMLELGRYELQGHELVGRRAAQVVDELITLGERGRLIAEAACRGGFPSHQVTELEESDQAIAFLQDHLRENDVVLVKGSRGMRMDRIVAALEAPR